MGTYSAATCAQTPLPEAGIWLDDSGTGAVEIYICAERADRLCGRIVWLKEPLNAQGLPKRDRHNPKEDLQTRPICGLPVLGNLYRVQEGGFDGGWIYDPKAGKSYSAAIQLARQDRLTVTGYVGMKFLSKSFTWTRAPADLGRCEGAPGSQAKAAKPAPPAQTKPAVEAAAVKAPASNTAATAPVTAPAPKPATTAAAPAPQPAAKPAASPQKAATTATAATGSSAAKVSSTSTTYASPTAKPATAAKPATGAAAAAPQPKAVATAAAANANKLGSAAAASAQPGAQSSPPAVKKKPVPMEADNTSPVHGPFGWGD